MIMRCKDSEEYKGFAWRRRHHIIGVLLAAIWLPSFLCYPADGPPVYDLSADFSLGSNPNGVWSYGYCSSIGGAFTPILYKQTTTLGSTVKIESWQLGPSQMPVVNHQGGTATWNPAQGTFPPGTVWYHAGENGHPENFGAIRFTVPVGGSGIYRLQTAVAPHFYPAFAGDADFHVVRNSVELFSEFLTVHAGTGYTNLVGLAEGDTIDFLIGRGADGNEYGSGLKIQAVLTLEGSAPAAPIIIAQPESQSVVIGSGVTFTVQAQGEEPLTFQWRFNEEELEGEEGPELTIDDVQFVHAGAYSVTVSNAHGAVNSDPAELTVSPILGSSYNLTQDFAQGVNPNGVWSYGWKGSLSGDFTLFSFYKISNGQNGVPVESWLFSPVQFPGVYHNHSAQTATSDNGQAIYPPGCVWVLGGENGRPENFGVIRFTAPYSGLYRLQSSVKSYLDGSLSGDTDFHVIRNDEELFGQYLPKNGHGGYTNETIALGLGDTVDFAVGRGADGNLFASGLKLEALLNLVTFEPSLPVIVAQPQSQTVIVGSSVTFAVQAIGTEPIHFQWLRNGSPLEGETGASLVIDEAEMEHAGTYSVVVSNEVGSLGSDEALLSVIPPDSETTFDLSRDFLTGVNPNGVWSYGWKGSHSGSFNQFADYKVANAQNGVPVEDWALNSYQLPAVYHNHSSQTATSDNGQASYPPGIVWFYGGENGRPENFGVIRFTAPVGGLYRLRTSVKSYLDTSLSGDTDYHVVRNGQELFGQFLPQNGQGGYTNFALALGLGDTLDLEVGRGFDGNVYGSGLKIEASLALDSSMPIEPIIVRQPENKVAYVGESVSFTVSAIGDNPISFQWLFNEEVLEGETAADLTIPAVQLSHAGSYAVKVSNHLGFVTSEDVILEVNPAPVCVPPPAGLIAWWDGDGSANDLVGVNYGSLRNGAGFGQGMVGQGFLLDGMDDFILVPDAASLRLTNEITFEMWFKSFSDNWGGLIDKRSGTVGANFGLDISHHGVQLYYNDPNVFGGDFSGNIFEIARHLPLPSINQFHHLAGTYKQLPGSEIQLMLYIDGALTETRTFAGNLANTVTAAPIAIGGVTGTCCFFSGIIDEISLYDRVLSEVEVESLYQAGSAGKCKTALPPIIYRPPQHVTVTTQGTVSFDVVANGSAPLSYQWYFNGNPIEGQTEATLELIDVQPAQAGAYSVSVSNDSGSATSTSATLTVNPLPPCLPPFSGLVGWWPGDGAGNDLAGGNLGELLGGVGFARGKVVEAFAFNGSDGRIRVPAATALDVGLSGGLTIETWVQPVSLNSVEPLVEWNGGVDATGVHLWLLGDAEATETGRGRIFANIVGTDGLSRLLQSPNALLLNGRFRHVALTYDKASGVATLFLDGAIVEQVNVGVFDPRTSSDLFLGASFRDMFMPNYYSGKMDEVSIYDRALAAHEIQAIYRADASGKCLTGQPPIVLTPPRSQSVAPGTTATFSVVASGSPPLTFQWIRNGEALEGETRSTLAIPDAQVTDQGTYAVMLSNPFGNVTSASAVLTVAATVVAPVIVTQPQSQTVLVGSTATFTVAVSGTGPLAYQWQFNGSTIIGGNSSTLTLVGVQPSQAGAYRVIVSNSAGNTFSASAILSVPSDGLAPVIVAAPGGGTILTGTDFIFTVGVEGTLPLHYQWYYNGAPIPEATEDRLILNEAQTSASGVYTVVVENEFGAASNLGSTLNVVDGFTGGTISFNNNSASRVYDVDASTPLPVGAQFLVQLFGGSSPGALAPVGGAIRFGPLPGMFVGGTRYIPSVAPGQSAHLQVKVWESAFGTTFEEALAGGGRTGSSDIFELVTGGGITPSLPLYQGFHGLVLNPGTGAPVPVIVSEPQDQTLLLGQTTQLTVEATGTPPLHYQWYLDGVALPGTDQAVLSLNNVTIGNDGEYSVVVRNLGGAVTSRTASVTVVIERTLTLIPPTDQTEGDVLYVPIQLTSQGDVGALSFVLRYNPDYLSAPEVLWDPILEGALREANVPILGQLRGVLALPGTTVPAGSVLLAVVQFRARTVPSEAITDLSIEAVDIAAANGDPILYGTATGGGSVRILGGGTLGDNNGNGRLDVGDATLLLRLLTQLDTVRSWDISRNDLNQNGALDSGDAVKILRAAAGLDPQPPAPGGGGNPANGKSGLAGFVTSLSPGAGSGIATLWPPRIEGTNGQRVTVEVVLENVTTPVAGAGFTLHYPAEALRLVGPSSHRPGPMVPVGSAVLWNLSPAQNYSQQNGAITMVASSGAPWRFRNGTLAVLVFEVQAAAAGSYLWDLGVSNVEISADGYAPRPLAGGSMELVGRDPVPGGLTGIGRLPTGAFQFSLIGDPGATYVIEYSADLKLWEMLGTRKNDTGVLTIQDPGASSVGRRFYRARALE